MTEGEEVLIEVAGDIKGSMVGDEMGMENFYSQNRLIKLNSIKKGSHGTISSLGKVNQALRSEINPAEMHSSLINIRSNNISQPTQLTDEERAVLGRMTTNEDDDNVRVTFSTYRRYIMDYFGGWKFIFFSNLAIIAFTQCKLYNDYLLGVWSQSTSGQQEDFNFYAFMIIGFSFLISCFVYLRSCTMNIFSWYATKKLHDDMMHSILNAPVNLFFDITPLSRILNIFSKDLN
jgi:hypothetical protein